jgi:nicotinamidase-related amidase
MKPTESDLICKGKNGLCGFSSTNLDFLLRQNGVKNVVLAGFLTNCCVESTMRSAYELGYQVYTLKDCCAATSVAAQDATFEHNFGMFSVPTTSTVSLHFFVDGIGIIATTGNVSFPNLTYSHLFLSSTLGDHWCPW